MDDLADLRRRRLVERLHQLGPRAIGELLNEIAVERNIGTVLDQKLARYAAITPAMLATTGADRFPPPPLHAVPGEISV